jgi:putative mycofactocin binding protein MftB
MSASTAAFESGSESTVPDGPVVPAPRFDPDAGWRLHHQVAVRPEPFGALLYHFGTRKLSFLKNRKIVEVVNALSDHPDARAALRAAGIDDDQQAPYVHALGVLVQSKMLVPKETS